MLEIVHDLAPGAQLYFATAFNGIAEFAQNILDLRAAGCDIIVDDVFYFVETPFQKGQAPSVVSTHERRPRHPGGQRRHRGGALYFSSAGELGQQDGRHVGDLGGGLRRRRGGRRRRSPGTGNLHDFGGGQAYDVLHDERLRR